MKHLKCKCGVLINADAIRWYNYNRDLLAGFFGYCPNCNKVIDVLVKEVNIQ